ncbi:ATP-binding protein [Myxococcus sp. MxC21-1]|nr:ATP-binding protein [Myxococcus sp. MxC21-1]WNZ65094.1 ATP-binding protein [Myxococcus sp. MxC21-1]
MAGRPRPGRSARHCLRRGRLGPGATEHSPDGARLRLHDGGAATSSADAPPLSGRDAVLAALEAEASRCIEEGVPGLCVLTGDVGHGTSRVLEALSTRLEAAGRCLVVRLRAPPPDAASSESLLDALRATAEPARVVQAPTLPLADERHAAARCLAEGLQRQAQAAPRVLLIDDAHRRTPPAWMHWRSPPWRGCVHRSGSASPRGPRCSG